MVIDGRHLTPDNYTVSFDAKTGDVEMDINLARPKRNLTVRRNVNDE